MVHTSPRTRVLGALVALSPFLLTACGAKSSVDIGPSPEAARSEESPESQVPPPQAPGETRKPETELLPSDPIVPDPVPETFEGPTPEEVDRAIREALGGDPIGLIRDPDASSVLPLEINDRVESWVNYFQNVIPERFGLYLERKGRWESMIRRKLREADMPQDLIYLALIESGMNPYAYSRAAAVGMWQFISSTGRMYDLEISFWMDERRDPEKATDAALRYLTDLYNQFGSWYLAAAAYNGGPGRVSRGLRQVDGGTFWDLADARLLRRETRDYVPKLIAAAIIGHDPERYGFGHIVEEMPDRVEFVTIPDATSFDVLAEIAGTEEETIRQLNPEFPQRVTPPNREVTIRIPVNAADGFEDRYAAIPMDERVTWTYHVVARGQTLGWIGGQYGVTVSALRAANNNVNPRRLRIGQRLVIPSPARVASAGSRSTRGNSVGSTTLESAQGPVTVVVQRGDSLWSIARRFSVSTSQIMEWNRLPSAVIHPGDRLEIKR